MSLAAQVRLSPDRQDRSMLRCAGAQAAGARGVGARRGLSSSSSWWSRGGGGDDDEDDDLDRDWYRVLDVSPDADDAAVKEAYRARCKEWHPDVNKSPAASVGFRRVRKAYEVLSTPAKRREFDARFRYRHDTGIHGIEQSVKHRERTGADRFANSIEAFLGKKFRWAIVGLLPLWMVLYVGVSTLHTKDPRRFDDQEATTPARRGSGQHSEKERMVRAGRCARTGEWLEPNTYENLRKLGPNKQLRMVPESWVTR